MFCKYCGNQIPEGTETCLKCGKQARNNSYQSGSYFSGIGYMFKKLFSKTPNESISMAAKENKPYWILIAAIGTLLCGLSIYVNTRQIIGRLISGSAGASFTDGIRCSKIFIYGVLIYIIGYAMIFLGIVVLTRVFRKSIGLHCIGNVVSVASVPLITAFLINLIVGVIYPPAVICITASAAMMDVVLLYVGIQKLDKFTQSPYWVFSIILFCVCIIVSIFIFTFSKSMITSIIQDFMNSLNPFGNIFR